MADFYSPYQDAATAVQGLESTFRNVAVGLAQNRAQQAFRQQQLAIQHQGMMNEGLMAKRRSALYDAQALLAAQEQKVLQNQEEAKDELGQAVGDIGLIYGGGLHGPDLRPEDYATASTIPRARAMSAMARLPDAARSKLPVNIAEMLQGADPRMQQLMATGTKATMNVPAGGTALDTISGAPLFQSPRTLNQGQLMVPGQGGSPLAFGQPPRQTVSDPTRLTATYGNILNGILNAEGGVPPSGSELRPIYDTAMQFITNAPHMRPTSPPSASPETSSRFQTLDEARKAGKQSGDVIELWDAQSGKFRKAKIN